MKREIKFRAWNGNKMLDDVYIPNAGTLNDVFLVASKVGLKIMQYTGLEDKNGKEIYEGDVVALNVASEIKFRVDWLGAGFWFVDVYGEREDKEPTINTVQHYKVVGNIYENPELIKS